MSTDTVQIRVGNVLIGCGAPVSVQTMANASPFDEKALAAQIERCASAGADLVRLTVPDLEAAAVFGKVRKSSPVPLVADIHFDYKCALAAIENGADALRLNPGNIGSADRIKQIVRAAKARSIPIRIGVNGGSLEKDIMAKFGSACAEALVESAMRHAAILESENFRDIVISVKASDVARTLDAYTLLHERCRYPLHLGVTEAGTFVPGTVRSSVALGILLSRGIGDTIRVSLTDAPEKEVRVGLEILRALGMREQGASITSCPTCGRTRADVFGVASAVEEKLDAYYRANPNASRPHVAVMGCVVNGPGEAKNADIALCGGEGVFTLFIRGKKCETIPSALAADEVLRRVAQWTASNVS